MEEKYNEIARDIDHLLSQLSKQINKAIKEGLNVYIYATEGQIEDSGNPYILVELSETAEIITYINQGTDEDESTDTKIDTNTKPDPTIKSRKGQEQQSMDRVDKRGQDVSKRNTFVSK